jgi:DNA polymerase-3 subunit epsilon
MSGPSEDHSSRLWQQRDLLADLMAAPSQADPGRSEASGSPSPVTDSREGDHAPAPQTLLILDTETTGLDPVSDHCLEVGAILFHVPSRAVLSQISFLLPVQSNPAEAINGIAAATTRLPQPWRQGLACFEAMAAAAEAVVAHNAAFDRQWFGRGELPSLPGPWICSMDDIRWPAERGLRPNPSVRDLALAYGVPVWAAHRALTDCIYLAQVFQRCRELEALLVAAREPRQLFRAQLSYAERHRAKQAGFRWNDPVPGAWSRRLSAREAAALPFPVLPVEAGAAAA